MTLLGCQYKDGKWTVTCMDECGLHEEGSAHTLSYALRELAGEIDRFAEGVAGVVVDLAEDPDIRQMLTQDDPETP